VQNTQPSQPIIKSILTKLNTITTNNNIKTKQQYKELQNKLKQMKLQPGIGAFYTIRLWNRLGLLYSVWELHGELKDETKAEVVLM